MPEPKGSDWSLDSLTLQDGWTALDASRGVSSQGHRGFADRRPRLDGAGSIFEHTKKQGPGFEHSPYKESEMLQAVQSPGTPQHMFKEDSSGRDPHRHSGRQRWHVEDVPPPGAYEVGSSFDPKKMRGGDINTSSERMPEPKGSDWSLDSLTLQDGWTALDASRGVSSQGHRGFADRRPRLDGAGSIFEHTKKQGPGFEHSPYKESEMLQAVQSPGTPQHMFKEDSSGRDPHRHSGRQRWHVEDVPPPGAYDVGSSFDPKKMRGGYINTSSERMPEPKGSDWSLDS